MRYLILLLFVPLMSAAQHYCDVDFESFNASPVKVELNPTYDLFNLRFDIIRQTEEIEKNDSTKKRENVDYHKLGFDLGNFLFVDLNGNLVLRIDQMLGITEKEPFTLLKETPQFWSNSYGKIYYRYTDGQFSSKTFFNRRFWEQFHTEKFGTSVEVYRRNHYVCSIEQDFDGLYYKYGNMRINQIYNGGNQHYNTSKHTFWGTEYFLENGAAYIGRQFIIDTNDQERTVEIYGWSRHRKFRPLYAIKLNDREMIIHSRWNNGYYIEYSPTEVKIYHRHRLVATYTKTDKYAENN